METVRPVKKGEEIFSHYGYRKDFLREPMKGKEWYYDEWQEYKKAFWQGQGFSVERMVNSEFVGREF